MWKDKWYIIILTVLGIIFYGLTLRGIIGNPTVSDIGHSLSGATMPFESSHERGPYVMALSLIKNHSFGFDVQSAEVALPDVGYYNGKYFIFFPPGVSILIIPLYLLGSVFNLGQVGSYITVVLFAIGALIFLYKISRNIFHFPPWISMIVPVIYGFGSTSWSYAVTIYQHQVTVFLLVSSFYAVWKYAQQKKLSWVWGLYAWIAYGVSIFVDYPDALLLAPVIVYFFFSSWKMIKKQITTKFSFRASFALTSLAFIILVLLHGYYNNSNFGGFTHLSSSIVSYQTIKSTNALKSKTGKQVIKSETANKTPVKFFKQENVMSSTSTLTVSVDRGLFLFSPIFILGLVGMYFLRKQITLASGTILAIIGANFLLYGSWGDPWGGYAFGPRYIIPSMAMFAILIGAFLTHFKYKLLGKILVLVLFIFSSAIGLAGALTTNIVPTKADGDHFKTAYNFILNFQDIYAGRSSSFLYNTTPVSHMLSLSQYYFTILGAITAVVITILFVISRQKYEV